MTPLTGERSILAVREVVQIEDLRLPQSAIPRSGDEVAWYLNASRQEGLLSGHAPGARPVVRTRKGYTFPLNSFDQIRWADPNVRIGPVWTNLGSSARIVRPTGEEYAEFGRLLTQPIPPGPTYLELIEEIWFRGFEVFVVGGTVRDVIAGEQTHDVDLVTTMPLERATPLLKSMYRIDPEIHGPNGYVRLGSKKSGEPFIDLKSFVFSDPGTEQAVFGGDFNADVSHRDFSCNAVYYDPKNNVLIDPTGRGIQSAETKTLEIVCDHQRPAYNRGQVVIRFVKFRCRGFVCSAETLQIIRSVFLPGLAAMTRSDLIDYLYRQVFKKTPAIDYPKLSSVLELVVVETCGEAVWGDLFAPVLVMVPVGAST